MRGASAATALLLAASASGGEEPPVPPPPAPERPVEEKDGAALDAVTAEMSALVEKVRGLGFAAAVSRRTKDRSEVLEEFRGKAPPAKGAPGGIHAETRALVFFGLLEEKDAAGDAGAAAAAFRAASVGGYYSSRDKVFTLVGGGGGHLNRMIVFHELVHAAEDQRYDFGARSKAIHDGDSYDGALAWRALVEGSAQLFTDRWVDAEPGLRTKVLEEIRGNEARGAPAGEKPGGVGEPAVPDPDRTPVYLALRESFPYFNGKLFLERVLPALPAPKEGEDPLAPLYGRPPASTEQVLHPEKWLDPPDLPRRILLPEVAPLLGEGWEAAFVDTAGEFGIGVAMNAWLYPRDRLTQFRAVLREKPGGYKTMEDLMDTPLVFRGTSGRSSAGWDGDRYVVLANGARSALAWVLVFDGPADAEEFAEGYAKVLKHKYRGAARGGDGVWTGTREGSTAVLVDGDRVVVAERVPAEALPKVVEALRKAEVVRDPRDALPAK